MPKTETWQIPHVPNRDCKAESLPLSYSKPEVVVKQHNDVLNHLLHAKLLKRVFSE